MTEPAEAETPDKATPDSEKVSDRLKMLHDYTRFHLGVYIPAASLLATLASGKLGNNLVNPCWIKLAAGLMMLAGFAGGIIATSAFEHSTVATFKASPIGPYDRKRLKLIRGRWYIRIEHTAFWASAIAALISLYTA